MSDNLYVISARGSRAYWKGHRLEGPAGTIIALPEALRPHLEADGPMLADFPILDEQTARELLAAQVARAREYEATLERHAAAGAEAEARERARQEKAAALLDLALSAVPVPADLSDPEQL